MINVFLVGAGYIAREHAVALSSPQLSTYGIALHVADPQPKALASFAEQFPGAQTYSSAEAMFAASPGGPGLAVIATPPVTHARLAGLALDAGLHVLCEKPLAMTTAEAETLAAQADAAGLILDSCDSRFRDVPATVHVRELLDAGALGALYHATFINTLRRSRTGIDWLTESAWFRDPKVSGGGVMMDWGPYDIAVLDEVFAPVSVTVNHAWTRSPVTGGPFREESLSVEQHVGASMTLRLRDGSAVELTYERSAATHGEELSLVSVDGDLGSVTWSWLDWVPGGVRFTDADADGAPRTATTTFEEPEIGFHSRPLARTLDAIARGVRPEAVNATSLFTFSWLRAVIEAAETGAAVTVVRQPVRAEVVL